MINVQTTSPVDLVGSIDEIVIASLQTVVLTLSVVGLGALFIATYGSGSTLRGHLARKNVYTVLNSLAFKVLTPALILTRVTVAITGARQAVKLWPVLLTSVAYALFGVYLGFWVVLLSRAWAYFTGWHGRASAGADQSEEATPVLGPRLGARGAGPEEGPSPGDPSAGSAFRRAVQGIFTPTGKFLLSPAEGLLILACTFKNNTSLILPLASALCMQTDLCLVPPGPGGMDTRLKATARAAAYTMLFMAATQIIKWSFGILLAGRTRRVSDRPAYGRPPKEDLELGYLPSSAGKTQGADSPIRTGVYPYWTPEHSPVGSQPSFPASPRSIDRASVHSAGAPHDGGTPCGMQVDKWKTLRGLLSPPTLAGIAAIIIGLITPLRRMFFGANPPLGPWITEAVDSVADCAIPISLLALGTMIGRGNKPARAGPPRAPPLLPANGGHRNVLTWGNISLVVFMNQFIMPIVASLWLAMLLTMHRWVNHHHPHQDALSAGDGPFAGIAPQWWQEDPTGGGGCDIAHDPLAGEDPLRGIIPLEDPALCLVLLLQAAVPMATSIISVIQFGAPTVTRAPGSTTAGAAGAPAATGGPAVAPAAAPTAAAAAAAAPTTTAPNAPAALHRRAAALVAAEAAAGVDDSPSVAAEEEAAAAALDKEEVTSVLTSAEEIGYVRMVLASYGSTVVTLPLATVCFALYLAKVM
ncbi:hypothetical protein H696_05926 [Fonticula alba]|uniref:Uncharacterized protein n=1 Tax=Fonticula alba TaxID=691883 RepID=A0A058Z046_FONAL|nr:hypothetical protein H696_05926 [Fonticula alba]KCV67639.1 hypothetical protein H696_05926 [Fonticula alba]|eukprot:XP_009497977.1 hypothetical protein H696_05926 [Fonticula alba]